MIHRCVFLFSYSCSRVPCLSWTVKLPAVFLRKNPSAPTNSYFFQHFCVFEPFTTMTVWNPSFHTEDNSGTHLQLLQKIQTLTDAPEGKPRIKSRGWTVILYKIYIRTESINLLPFSKHSAKLWHFIHWLPGNPPKWSLLILNLKIIKINIWKIKNGNFILKFTIKYIELYFCLILPFHTLHNYFVIL